VKNTRPNFLLRLWLGAAVLWWGVVFYPVQGRGAERTLSVVSSSSGLTVEAHEVGAEEVLQEIGRQLGFTVVVNEAARPTVNVSVKDATLEEVLQQILRGENYALVYRNTKGKSAQGSEGIGKVLLLSPSGAGAANPVAESGRPGQERPQPLSRSQTSVTHAPEAARPAQVSDQEVWARLREKSAAIARDDQVTARELLEAQALERVLAKREMEAARYSGQSSVEEDAETAEAQAAREQEPPAVTIQRVQRNLAILVDGFDEAKRNFFNALMNQGQGGR
jgi:hypothetical protein